MPKSNAKHKITKMSDLALIAGVSKSTVSRALAGNELVNKETRDRIATLAREHNYRINTKARNFRTKQSLTIGLMVPSSQSKWQINDPFFLELLGSIAVTLNERGHELLLSSAKLSSEHGIDELVSQSHCDGMIFIGQADIHQQLNDLASYNHAMVVWGGKLEDQRYITVGGDNFKGGFEATRHLISLGKKRIAFLGNHTTVEGGMRFEGYKQALREAGYALDESLMIMPEAGKNGGLKAVQKRHADGLRFDGLFALSDILAMAAIRALAAENVSIPEDVSVVGYDDISLAGYYVPPISSIRQDRELGGQLLVEKLLALLDGQSVSSSLLETTLVVRQSSVKKD
jgi:DNA-binding LacI/PurR family transcriptional regulator